MSYLSGTQTRSRGGELGYTAAPKQQKGRGVYEPVILKTCPRQSRKERDPCRRDDFGFDSQESDACRFSRTLERDPNYRNVVNLEIDPRREIDTPRHGSRRPPTHDFSGYPSQADPVDIDPLGKGFTRRSLKASRDRSIKEGATSRRQELDPCRDRGEDDSDVDSETEILQDGKWYPLHEVVGREEIHPNGRTEIDPNRRLSKGKACYKPQDEREENGGWNPSSSQGSKTRRVEQDPCWQHDL